MKEIAKNEFYELMYDESKNWVIWTMKGFWKSMEYVPDYDKDWEEVVKFVKPEFKIFADLSTLKAIPDDVKNIQDNRQKKLMEIGCSKVSCYLESSITKMCLRGINQSSGMERIVKYFDNEEDARTWLNK